MAIVTVSAADSFTLPTTVKVADANLPTRLQDTTLKATIATEALPKWKATTDYTAGQAVVNPSGDVVTAKVDFTSGASYSSANWNISPTYAPNGVASPRQAADNKSGALDWRHEGTAGYLTHFVMGASSLALAGCYAAGTDLGLGDGFFASHKNSGAGLRLIGHGGSSILQYSVGYSHSTLYNGEIYKGNQGIKLFAKIGEGFGDGVATSGSTTFTSATAAFTSADIGATISQTTNKGTLNVSGTIPSGTTIASINSATSVELSAACTAAGTGLNFLIGGRTPASTQSMFTLYDTNGTTKRYEFTLGKYTGVVPHEIQSNDIAAQSLLVKAASGHTAEIFTVLKDGSASGALSVIASGLVAIRFGSSLSNAGNTASNAVNIANSGTSAHSMYITQGASQTGDQISLRDSAGALASRFNKNNVFMTKVATAPADSDITTNEVSLTFDSTVGSSRVYFKGKNSAGTIVTGSVALS